MSLSKKLFKTAILAGGLAAAMALPSKANAQSATVDLEDHLTYPLPQPSSPEVWEQNYSDVRTLVRSWSTVLGNPVSDSVNLTVRIPNIVFDRPGNANIQLGVAQRSGDTTYEAITNPIPVSTEEALGSDLPQGAVFRDILTCSDNNVHVRNLVIDVNYPLIGPSDAAYRIEAATPGNVTNCFFNGRGVNGPARAIAILNSATQVSSAEFQNNFFRDFPEGIKVELAGTDVSRWRENDFVYNDTCFVGNASADLGSMESTSLDSLKYVFPFELGPNDDPGNNVFYIRAGDLFARINDGEGYPFQGNWFYVDGELLTTEQDILDHIDDARPGAASARGLNAVGSDIRVVPFYTIDNPLYVPETSAVEGWQSYR